MGDFGKKKKKDISGDGMPRRSFTISLCVVATFCFALEVVDGLSAYYTENYAIDFLFDSRVNIPLFDASYAALPEHPNFLINGINHVLNFQF